MGPAVKIQQCHSSWSQGFKVHIALQMQMQMQQPQNRGAEMARARTRRRAVCQLWELLQNGQEQGSTDFWASHLLIAMSMAAYQI